MLAKTGARSLGFELYHSFDSNKEQSYPSKKIQLCTQSMAPFIVVVRISKEVSTAHPTRNLPSEILDATIRDVLL